MIANKSKKHHFKKLKHSYFGFISSFELRVSSLNDNRGAIGILTTLVLSFALVLIAVNMVLIGISSRENAFNLNQSEQVFIPVEGCAEDALIRLNRNNNYNGGSYTIDDVSCDVIVSGTDPNRDVTVTGSKNNITRDLFLRVQLTPTFAIIDWND